MRAKLEVLFDLDYTQAFSSPFGLYRNHIVVSATLNTNVEFVGLNLADSWHSRSQVILKRVTREAGEDVYEAVVPYLGQKRLLVLE